MEGASTSYQLIIENQYTLGQEFTWRFWESPPRSLHLKSIAAMYDGQSRKLWHAKLVRVSEPLRSVSYHSNPLSGTVSVLFEKSWMDNVEKLLQRAAEHTVDALAYDRTPNVAALLLHNRPLHRSAGAAGEWQPRSAAHGAM